MEQKQNEEPVKKKKQLPVLKVAQTGGPEIKMQEQHILTNNQRSDSALYLDKLKISKDGLALKKNMKFSDLQLVPDGFLGKGAFGSVQKYIHVPTNQVIAMKEIVYSGGQEQFKSLKTEVDTLIKCDCKYLIQCYGVFFEQQKIMFALEYMDFDSLAFIIKQLHQIPEVILGIIVYQVLKGLEFLHHTMKLIHRDIKPSNLLINSEGQVKIADFGISAQLEETLGKKNTWIGTTRYMSVRENQVRNSFLAGKTQRRRVYLGFRSMESRNDYYRGRDWKASVCRGIEVHSQFVYIILRGDGPIKFWDLNEMVMNKPTPKLPAGYSPELQEFVDICMQKQSGQRSSAAKLLVCEHKFVQKYAKVKQEKFKQWLSTLAPEKK